MQWRKVMAAVGVMIMLTATSAFGAEPINTLDRKGLFGYKTSGVALRGYDTVAYFTQSRPVEGSDEFSTSWSGATWQFSSQAHLDLFVEDPQRYAPQYGGYCAFGVAMGYLVKIEPESWTIVDDKLYLNYDSDVQRDWEEDIPGFITSADGGFEALLASDE